MGDRQAVVVYESMFGDTASIADAVARGLAEEVADVACCDVSGLDVGEPVYADLLVVGAPTHRFTLSSPGTREEALRRGAPPGHATIGLQEWLTHLEADRQGLVVATFDTRLALFERLTLAAATAMGDLARERGFRVVGEPMGFFVEHTRGPVLEGEILRATSWGRSLAAELAALHQR
ncbi:hypothetical protein JCM18899A_41310 [Nocardioides sp. AN3]